ncbi:hypothetical protein [Aquipseudomonas campi]
MNPRKHLLTNMLTGLALLQTAYFTNAAQAATPAMQQQPGAAMMAQDPAMTDKGKAMMEKQPTSAMTAQDPAMTGKDKAMMENKPASAMTAHDPAMMGKDKAMMEKQPPATQY